jgi:hypothetical protein
LSVPRPAIDPLPHVRQSVRDLLLSSAAFHELDPESRRSLAQALVTVCHAAVALFQEEAQGDAAQGDALAPAAAPTLAAAQSAGTQLSGVAADRVAGTTRSILNAVSFPRFVTELINGVFKALVDSNQQQMRAYLDLIKNVAASTEGFADANLAPARARQWLVESFPAAFEFESAVDQNTDASDPGQEPRVRLKDGAAPPSEAALRTMLGAAANETVSPGDPENGLVPLVRRTLARQRQQMLASMVMLGMQRIVVESGRLNAAMRFHIDTRSAAASDQGSSFDEHNQLEAGVKFGFGPWAVDAKMTNTIGYVSTERDQTTEEMNTSLDLNSSVELYFKTDYLPLERMAGQGQIDRIKVNTLNPDAEAQAAETERQQRLVSARQSEAARGSELDSALRPRDGTSRGSVAAPPAAPSMSPAVPRQPGGSVSPGSPPSTPQRQRSDASPAAAPPTAPAPAVSHAPGQPAGPALPAPPAPGQRRVGSPPPAATAAL